MAETRAKVVPVKVLRLGDSNDRFGDVEKGARTHEIAERLLSEASGQPVETVVKLIWPDPALTGAVERWLERYQPDLVLLRANAFWYNHESVPLRLARLLGPFGGPLARAGLRTGEGWLARTALFHWLQRQNRRFHLGTYYFEPEQVLEVMEATIRTIVRHESVGLVVKVGDGGRMYLDEPRRALERRMRRRYQVHLGLRAIAEAHGAITIGRETPVPEASAPGARQADRIHRTAAGHALFGQGEGEALIAAWRKANNLPAAPVAGGTP